ncbi:hypothetical protein [Desulfatiglans anilini]|uniref:hypothetical protein n=1 Tax=Desulfatiglans anilini TaxID=90728 RepID=UPI00041055EE|nr:hypothetical protein [Desulfatiglans anilini]
MPFNLIVPIAADKPEWVDTAPYMFDLHPLGNLMVFESIRGLMLEEFDRIYITILRKHDERFHLKPLLERQFEVAGMFEKLRVVVLENPTRNQPETIAKTIEHEKIKGPILIKDSDNYFECSLEPTNNIAIFPLDALEKVNPSDKSYVAIDDGFYITNIIEKKIISRYFCAGGYSFESAAIYMKFYRRFAHCDILYLSHIIYGMLMDQLSFRPCQVSNYLDWGTQQEWREYCASYKTIFLAFEMLQTNKKEDFVRKIRRLYESGTARLIIIAGNNRLMQSDYQVCLAEAGIKYHEIITGVFPYNMHIISEENQLNELKQKIID